MERRTCNPEGDPTILLVLGFGNRVDGDSEQWAIEQLTDAGFQVEAVELPTAIRDFEADYRQPIQRLHDEIEPAIVLAHSLGGLITASLETDATAVYLSPWWGMYDGKVADWERWLVPKLPITWPILPIRTTRDEMGARLSDADWERVPKRLSPVSISEIYRAQQALPEIDDDAVVFVSLEDTIIGLEAVGAAVSPDQIRLYDGAHQLFSVRDREAVMGRVIAELRAIDTAAE